MPVVGNARPVRGLVSRQLGCRRPRRMQLPKMQAQAKMYVPSDSFDGQSPEKFLATHARSMQTFIACKVILAQLAGHGRGDLGSYNVQSTQDLRSLMQEVPMRDPDEFCRQMLKRNEALGMRIMEVRAAYAKEDFEWDTLQRLSVRDTEQANLKLMKEYATAAFAKDAQHASCDLPNKST